MTRFKHDLILRIHKNTGRGFDNRSVCTVLVFVLCKAHCIAILRKGRLSRGGTVLCAVHHLWTSVRCLLMSMQRISEIVYAQFLAVAVSDFIMYIVIWLLSKHLPNILPGVAALIGQVILAAVWAYNAHHAYFKIFPLQATAVIYDTRQGMEKLIGKYGLDDKYKVVLTATADECIANLAMLDGVSTVFMSGTTAMTAM